MKQARIIIGIFSVLYGIQLFFKFNNLPFPVWISSYLADLMCLPILLYLDLISIRYIKKNPSFIIDKKMILFSWIYVGLIFEFALPQYSTRYTSDILDVLMYGIGAIFYFQFQRKYLKEPFIEMQSTNQ